MAQGFNLIGLVLHIYIAGLWWVQIYRLYKTFTWNTALFDNLFKFCFNVIKAAKERSGSDHQSVQQLGKQHFTENFISRLGESSLAWREVRKIVFGQGSSSSL